MTGLVPASRTTSNDCCSPSATNPVCIHDIAWRPFIRSWHRAGVTSAARRQRAGVLDPPAEILQLIDKGLTRGGASLIVSLQTDRRQRQDRLRGWISWAP